MSRNSKKESISDSSSSEDEETPKRPPRKPFSSQKLDFLSSVAPLSSVEALPAPSRIINSSAVSYENTDDEEDFNREDDDANIAPIMIPSGRNSADKFTRVEEKETMAQWRGRLWPGKAIISYCRMITRCIPPDISPNHDLRTHHIQLGRHWSKDDLISIGPYFDSVSKHSAAFFLLIAEESRASIGQQSITIDAGLHSTEFNDSSTKYSLGWLNCEIISIIAETEMGSLPSACHDPALGAVWVVSVAIRTPNININDDVCSPNKAPKKPKQRSQQFAAKESSLSGGDVVILRSTAWSKPLLGIVQPWDPDYDLKFGVNLNIRQNMTVQQQTGANEVTTANIMICVDCGGNDSSFQHFPSSTSAFSAQGKGNNNTGGWAAPGSIFAGVSFSMTVLGNVMTYIRECQALLSLRLLNSTLKAAVLRDNGLANPSIAATAVDISRPPVHVPLKLWQALSREYNTSQLRALSFVCQRSTVDGKEHLLQHAIGLLQGPPGTGKTKTILGILSLFLAGALKTKERGVKVVAGSSFHNTAGSTSSSNRQSSSSDWNLPRDPDKPRILLCAPSNTAVDELAYRLLTQQGIFDVDGNHDESVNIVRIGHVCKDEYYKKHHDRVSYSSRAKSDDAVLSMQDEAVIKVVERVVLENIVESRRRLLQQSLDNSSSAAATAASSQQHSFKAVDIRRQVLEKADIVLCTLSGAGSQPILEVILRIPGYKFDAVIIDEAAQAVEPSLLIPFKFNPRCVIMVGDPCQLPATVFSSAAKEANYGQSLFERLQLAGLPVCMLETQYRMHPKIAEYPSQRFYHGQLLTASTVTATSHARLYHSHQSQRFRPFLFHNLTYSKHEMDATGSVRNLDEAKYVLMLFDELIRNYPQYRHNIGIIVPYRSQRRLILQLFRDKYGAQCRHFDTEIATVDAFQGREKDIIIFSCTRSLPKQQHNSQQHGQQHGQQQQQQPPSIGFLREWRRLNVAITRAKYALWIVGQAQCLSVDSEWQELIKHAQDTNAFMQFQSAGEALNINHGIRTGSKASSGGSSNSGGGGGSFQQLQQRDHHRGQPVQQPKSQQQQQKQQKDRADRDRSYDTNRDRDRDRDRNRDRVKDRDRVHDDRSRRDRSNRDRSRGNYDYNNNDYGDRPSSNRDQPQRETIGQQQPQQAQQQREEADRQPLTLREQAMQQDQRVRERSSSFRTGIDSGRNVNNHLRASGSFQGPQETMDVSYYSPPRRPVVPAAAVAAFPPPVPAFDNSRMMMMDVSEEDHTRTTTSVSGAYRKRARDSSADDANAGTVANTTAIDNNRTRLLHQQQQQEQQQEWQQFEPPLPLIQILPPPPPVAQAAALPMIIKQEPPDNSSNHGRAGLGSSGTIVSAAQDTSALPRSPPSLRPLPPLLPTATTATVPDAGNAAGEGLVISAVHVHTPVSLSRQYSHGSGHSASGGGGLMSQLSPLERHQTFYGGGGGGAAVPVLKMEHAATTESTDEPQQQQKPAVNEKPLFRPKGAAASLNCQQQTANKKQRKMSMDSTGSAQSSNNSRSHNSNSLTVLRPGQTIVSAKTPVHTKFVD